MPTRALCLEHNVGITFLSQVGVHEPTLARAVLGSRSDAVIALIDQVLKLNAALLEHATDRPRAALRSFLVLAKDQEQRALVLPAVRQRILNRLENACDLVLPGTTGTTSMWPMNITGLRAGSEPASVTNSEWPMSSTSPAANTRGQACCI